MSSYNKHINQRLERLQLSNKPTLVITRKLQQQIKFLHDKVGRNEWSGELITSEIGTIHDLDDWKIVCEEIFLADVGSPGFTGYEVDKGGFKAADIGAMYDQFPGLLEGKQKNHHIHTHHNMGAFFSGTDWEQLEDRGCQSNYFMMLVVDFQKTYKAKVAWKAEQKVAAGTELHFANNTDELGMMTLTGAAKEKEVLVVMDCNIEYEEVPTDITLEDTMKIMLLEFVDKEKVTPEEVRGLCGLLHQQTVDQLSLVDESFRQRYESVKKAIEEESRSKYSKGSWGGSSQTTFPNSGNNYRSGSNAVRGGSQQQIIGFQLGGTDTEDASSFDRYEKIRDKAAPGKEAPGKGGKKRGRKSKAEKEAEKNATGTTAGLSMFELRHATAMINACLDNDPRLNFSPVSKRLSEKGQTLKYAYLQREFTEMHFVEKIEDLMEVMFPEKADMEGILEMYCRMIELLQPYTYVNLIKVMVTVFVEEARNMAEELQLLHEEDKTEELSAADFTTDDPDLAAALSEARLQEGFGHRGAYTPLETPGSGFAGMFDNSEEADTIYS